MQITITGAIAMNTSAAQSRSSKRKSFRKTWNSVVIACSVAQRASGQGEENVLQARLLDVELQHASSVQRGALEHAGRELEVVDAHAHDAAAVRCPVAVVA